MVEYQRFGKMNIFTAADLDQMPRFTRANLINCLTGIKPAILIGTTSVDGVSNLGLFSSVFHLGADPALIGFVQRPLTTYSHTYKNILASGVYTMNHVTSDRIAEAHHTSAKFGDNESEFAACGFGEKFIAPLMLRSSVEVLCNLGFGLFVKFLFRKTTRDLSLAPSK